MNEAVSLSYAQILMEGIKEMVFVVKVAESGFFTYAFINNAVMEKTCLTSDSIGKTFNEAHSSKLASLLQEKYMETVESSQSVAYEDSFYSTANRLFYSKTLLTPLFDGSGKCTHIVSLVTDVTDEKAAALESKGIRQRLEEKSARYQSLYDCTATAIFTVDVKGHITGGNAAGQKVSGYLLKEVAGENFIDFVSFEDNERAEKHFLAACNGEYKDRRMNFISKSRTAIACLIKFIPISLEGEITGFYMVIKDMTELDKVSSLYEAGEKNFQIIAENVHDVIILMDFRQKYLYLSPSIESIFGFKSHQIIGQKPFFNVHPDDVAIISEAFDQAAKSGTAYMLQLRLLHKDRAWVWAELNGTPVYDERKRFKHMVMVARDISIQKEYENQLRHFAYYDSLTELPNRRYFQEYAMEQLESNEKNHENLAVVILDIDDFKEINDQWGHETGDAVIREFGHRLNSCMHGENMAARLGGDEFVILLTEASSKEQVEKVADSIYQVMEKTIEVKGLSLKISISMGIALSSSEKVPISVMMKRADMAMYKAKKKEKNSFQLSST